MTIQTHDGPRIIPHWAKCYCVTSHRPSYLHPYPFALPNGVELWLCPNTYHQAQALLSMYASLDGPPESAVIVQFNNFVRSLMKYYWQQVLNARESEKDFEEWKSSQPVEEEDYEYLNIDIQEVIKRTAV